MTLYSLPRICVVILSLTFCFFAATAAYAQESSPNPESSSTKHTLLDFYSVHFSGGENKVSIQGLGARVAQPFLKLGEGGQFTLGYSGGARITQFSYNFPKQETRGARQETITTGIYATAGLSLHYVPARTFMATLGLDYAHYLADGLLIEDTSTFDSGRRAYSPPNLFALAVRLRYFPSKSSPYAIGLLLEQSSAQNDLASSGFGLIFSSTF